MSFETIGRKTILGAVVVDETKDTISSRSSLIEKPVLRTSMDATKMKPKRLGDVVWLELGERERPRAWR